MPSKTCIHQLALNLFAVLQLGRILLSDIYHSHKTDTEEKRAVMILVFIVVMTISVPGPWENI